jgi:methionyl-tRNA synthetase
MTQRYFDGALPSPDDAGPAEARIAEIAASVVSRADDAMVALDFSGGLAAIWDLVNALNLYLSEQEPWKVAKAIDTDPAAKARVATVLYTAAEGLRVLAVLLNAVLPTSCAAVWESLGASAQLGDLASQRIGDAGRWGQLQVGARLTKGESLFPRLTDDPAR